MPRNNRRRRKSNRDKTTQALYKLLDSPFSSLAPHLKGFLRDALPNDSDKAKTFIVDFASLLPSKYDRAFWFDRQLILAIADEWGLCANGIINCYSSDWRYEIIPLRGLKKDISVELIYFREDHAENSTRQPDLLDYPWLCHELGHSLLLRHSNLFFHSFKAAVESHLANLRYRRLPLRGRALDRSMKIENQIQSYWYPSVQSTNWPFEIAIDVLCMKCCGPAYLDAYYESHKQSDINPFLLDPSHPPVSLRTASLLFAAKKLNWSDTTPAQALHSLCESWDKREKSNNYVALTPHDLAYSCVEEALVACKNLNMKTLTPDSLKQLHHCAETKELEGTDLIVAAWLMDQNKPGSYSEWESHQIAATEIPTL